MTASTIGPVFAAVAAAGAEVSRGYRRGMSGDADIAPIAALIGDPTRARVLTALTDGRALRASRLAAEAGGSRRPRSASTWPGCWPRGWSRCGHEGRSRFYRLAVA